MAAAQKITLGIVGAGGRGDSEPPIGVQEAMDMTLPGLLSQQSIREGGLRTCRPGTRAQG